MAAGRIAIWPASTISRNSPPSAVSRSSSPGATGYSDAFYNKKTSIPGARPSAMGPKGVDNWLSKGSLIRKLAIFGLSYGDYAALQSNVLDPHLFKAVMAVAPVTDFDMIKDEARGCTSYDLVQREVGDEQTAIDASPLGDVASFQAPMLMFLDDNDLNINVGEPRWTQRCAVPVSRAGSSSIPGWITRSRTQD